MTVNVFKEQTAYVVNESNEQMAVLVKDFQEQLALVMKVQALRALQRCA